MPKKIRIDPRLESAHFYVTFQHNGEVSKKEVCFTFEAEWQGQPCQVRLEADRYRHTAGLSDWRVVPTSARRYTDLERKGPLVPLTETAKSRLGDACRPLALAWLTSPACDTAERRAFYEAILRGLNEPRLSFEEPTREVRRLIAKHAERLDAAALTHLTNVCDAIDKAGRLYRLS